MSRGFTVLTVLALAATMAQAGTPDVDTIVKSMKAALEPPRPSVRRLTLEIEGPDGPITVGTAVQARKIVAGQPQMLTIVLGPEAMRGIGWLLRERAKDRPEGQWVYVPALRRVRAVAAVTAYGALLGSGFSSADLAFERLDSTYRLLGIENREGTRTYEVEAVVPKSVENREYSRSLTWVDAKTFLPIERDFYDLAGTLYRVEFFERADAIDGIPTIQRIRMENLQSGERSDISITNVRYNVDLPDSLFEPNRLYDAITAPVLQIGEPQ